MTRSELLRKASPAEIFEWPVYFQLEEEGRAIAGLAAEAEAELQRMKARDRHG